MRSTSAPQSTNVWQLPSAPSSPSYTATGPPPTPSSRSARHAWPPLTRRNVPPPQPSRRPSAATPPSSLGSLPNHRLRPILRLLSFPLHGSLGLRHIPRLLSLPPPGSLRLQPLLRLYSPPPSPLRLALPCNRRPPRTPRSLDLHTLVGRGLAAPPPTPKANAPHAAECSLPRATGL